MLADRPIAIDGTYSTKLELFIHTVGSVPTMSSTKFVLRVIMLMFTGKIKSVMKHKALRIPFLDIIVIKNAFDEKGTRNKKSKTSSLNMNEGVTDFEYSMCPSSRNHEASKQARMLGI